MKKLAFSRLLMISSLLLLAAFEGYWLHKLFEDENRNLRKELDLHFRDAINTLQRYRFERDTSFFAKNNVTPGLKNKKGDAPHLKKDNTKIGTTFVFRSSAASASLKDIAPENIQSINVRNPSSATGVPPQGLIEVILRKKFNSEDSGKIALTADTGLFNSQRLTTVIYQGEKKEQKGINTLHDSSQISSSTTGRISGVELANMRIGKKDTGSRRNVLIRYENDHQPLDQSPIIRFFASNKTLNDSIPVSTVDSVFRKELQKSQHLLPYTILFQAYKGEKMRRSDFESDTTDRMITSKVFVGYSTPYSYQALFNQTTPFLLKKMGMQIGGSVLLLLFVTAAFVIFYRNLLAQQRLAIIKNDFISNITHELKTPIATVTVAIEALRNFGGIQSPERTKEYLDISAAELQRLSMLVDKVLKLSMFEKQEITLQKESFDLKELIMEVMASMRLQFEKMQAVTLFETTGDNFMIDADKLHITSVVYNLLDNALKYSPGIPAVTVTLTRKEKEYELQVKDKGMGIDTAYHTRIFEQFFRVPEGDRHNTKGYGLGLSYVNHIIEQHAGTIEVVSEPGKGSTFIIRIPIQDSIGGNRS